MNADQLLAQVTKLRFWLVVGVLVLIALHPEWIFGMFREDLTAWDIVLGIVGFPMLLVGAYVFLSGLQVRDGLAVMIGLAIAAVGVFLLLLAMD